jgi:hypothetical protein
MSKAPLSPPSSSPAQGASRAVDSVGKLFADALLKELGTPKTAVAGLGGFVVSGIFHHRGGSSAIVIKVGSDPWRLAPEVYCDELWVRRCEDWHFETKSNSFCWVLAEEWRRYFSLGDGACCPEPMKAQDAALWLVAAMGLMLGRHWTGAEYGIEGWPLEWEDYSHGKKGVQEFLRGTYRKS